MNERACGRALLLLALVSLLGCEGMGRELVGRRPGPEMLEEAECPPTSCAVPDVPSDLAPALHTNSVDFDACGGLVDDCDAGSVTAAGASARRGCFRVWTLDEQVGEALERQAFHCSALTAIGTGGAQRVSAQGVTLTSTNLSFESAEPATFELRRANLVDVRILLQGPIAIHFIDSTLQDVRFELAPDAQVEVERGYANGLMVSGEGASRMGTVTLRRTRFDQSHLRAATLRLESVVAYESDFDASVFQATDLTWGNGRLSTMDGLLSSAFLSKISVKKCEALTFIGSGVYDSELAPCEGPLRLYKTTVEGSTLDGPIQADSSILQYNRFGAQSATDLIAWDTQIVMSALCDEQRSLVLGEKSAVSCTHCNKGDAVPKICALPDAMLELFANDCEPLKPMEPLEPGEVLEQGEFEESVAVPPECVGRLPQRERPK